MSSISPQATFASGIRELSIDEIYRVSGREIDAPEGSPLLDAKTTQSNRLIDYTSSVVSAVCGYFAKSLTQTAVCAAAGEAVKDLASGLEKYPPTDPMDTKLGINTGK